VAKLLIPALDEKCEYWPGVLVVSRSQFGYYHYLNSSSLKHFSDGISQATKFLSAR
jgi:hypothetical protein